jgi:hypothetical protein
MCPTTDGTGGQEKLAPFQHASLLQGLLLPKTPPCSPLLYLLFLLSHTSGKNKIKKTEHTKLTHPRGKEKAKKKNAQRRPSLGWQC